MERFKAYWPVCLILLIIAAIFAGIVLFVHPGKPPQKSLKEDPFSGAALVRPPR